VGSDEGRSRGPNGGTSCDAGEAAEDLRYRGVQPHDRKEVDSREEIGLVILHHRGSH